MANGGCINSPLTWFAVLGAVVAALSFFEYVRARRKARVAAQRKLKLQTHGVTAEGKITQVQRSNMRINDRPAYYVVTIDVPQQDGTVAELTAALAVDLEGIPRVQPGKTISVRYLPEDMDTYEVLFEHGWSVSFETGRWDATVRMRGLS